MGGFEGTRLRWFYAARCFAGCMLRLCDSSRAVAGLPLFLQVFSCPPSADVCARSHARPPHSQGARGRQAGCGCRQREEMCAATALLLSHSLCSFHTSSRSLCPFPLCSCALSLLSSLCLILSPIAPLDPLSLVAMALPCADGLPPAAAAAPAVAEPEKNRAKGKNKASKRCGAPISPQLSPALRRRLPLVGLPWFLSSVPATAGVAVYVVFHMSVSLHSLSVCLVAACLSCQSVPSWLSLCLCPSARLRAHSPSAQATCVRPLCPSRPDHLHIMCAAVCAGSVGSAPTSSTRRRWSASSASNARRRPGERTLTRTLPHTHLYDIVSTHKLYLRGPVSAVTQTHTLAQCTNTCTHTHQGPVSTEAQAAHK